MSRLRKITLIIFILIVIATGVSLYLGVHDTFRVKGVIKGAKKAVESKDIDGLMSYVSSAYSDNYGFDYPMVKRFMSSLFKDFDKFEVIIANPVIKVKDDLATAQFFLWISVDWNGQPAYIVGTNRAGARVRAYFKKGLLRWKVVKIEGVR